MPLIVDGHNLIGKMPSISLADPCDEEKLIAKLAQHLLSQRQKCTVVFDKGREFGIVPQQIGAKLQVIFAPPGTSADTIIIDMIRQDPNPKGLTIVSSDNEIRQTARSRRARLVSAEDFAEELESSPRKPQKKASGDGRFDDIEIEEWLDYFKKGRTQ
jgi:predicted RNA-binding protein with PIN domain